ncbi:MAG: hypothetical protein CM15mP18_3930 [Methanobacteriota archaeon]|nr:MAG: hypothetical protein CM15mP18_3930 [Euryarchaeota archaeon]
MPRHQRGPSTSVGSALRKRPPILSGHSLPEATISKLRVHPAAIHHTLGNHEEAAPRGVAVLSIDPDHALLAPVSSKARAPLA